jgi:anti-sigma regulatory factor (Ser/Thr protein kinase)
VIFETALSQQSDIAEGIAAGVHYYLTKPFNFRLLLAVVKAALYDRFERQRIAGAVARAAGAIQLLHSGDFELQTPDEARALATLLAAATPSPDSVALGLSELLLNAIEHGNLGLKYADKSELLIDGKLHEELSRRLLAEPWRDRRVRVHAQREAAEFTIRIEDEGDGFDPSAYLELDPARALDPNGRGIAMARMISFSRIEYSSKGNTVSATVAIN